MNKKNNINRKIKLMIYRKSCELHVEFQADPGDSDRMGVTKKCCFLCREGNLRKNVGIYREIIHNKLNLDDSVNREANSAHEANTSK